MRLTDLSAIHFFLAMVRWRTREDVLFMCFFVVSTQKKRLPHVLFGTTSCMQDLCSVNDGCCIQRLFVRQHVHQMQICCNSRQRIPLDRCESWHLSRTQRNVDLFCVFDKNENVEMERTNNTQVGWNLRRTHAGF